MGLTSTRALALQESHSPFHAATVQFPDDTSIVRLADVDGDGLEDAIGFYWADSNKSSVQLQVYRNWNNGTYQWLWKKELSAMSLDAWGLEAGDFDGDPKADLAVAFQTSSTNSTVRIFDTSSSSVLGQTAMWTVPFVVKSMVTADFDGDGLDDLAVAGAGVRMYRNTGAGFLLTSSLPQGTLIKSGAYDAAPGPDLFVIAGDQVTIVSCSGASMTPGASFQTGISPAGGQHPVTGDIDGDGDDDIVLFSGGSDCVVLRQAAASFTMEPSYTGGPATDLFDVDGDGDLDGVCCGGGGGPYPEYNTMTADFRISLNDGSGTFAKANEMIGFGAFRLAGADDVDGDGDLDLIAGRAVIFNRGTGFALTPQPYTGASDAIHRSIDIDTDGDPDLRPAGAWLNSMLTLENNAAGDFEASYTDFPKPPVSVYKGTASEGDFDGDGDVDIVLYRWNLSQTFLDMRLLLNTSGGSYVDAGPATAGGAPFQPSPYFGQTLGANLVADLDADGDLDIYAGRDGGLNNGRVWLNDGTGFFTAGQVLWFLPIASDAIDLDQDGLIDLVGAGEVAYGLGGGNFTAAAYLFGPVDSVEDRVAILDLDGDGSLDVASWPHSGDNTLVLVHYQNAPRVFQTSQLKLDYPFSLSFSNNRRVIGGDFDADGDGDLLVTPIGTDSRRGRIFWNDGTGLFPETTDQMIDVPSLFIDVDGDGDQDLVGKRIIRGTFTDATTNGLRRQYGDSVAGLGGLSPTLGATSASPAGGTLELKFSGAAGGSTALLAVGLSEAYAVDLPVTGATMLTSAPVLILAVPLSGLPGEAGTGTAALPMPLPLALSGSSFFGQAFVIDSAGASGLLSQTNGLEIAIP